MQPQEVPAPDLLRPVLGMPVDDLHIVHSPLSAKAVPDIRIYAPVRSIMRRPRPVPRAKVRLKASRYGENLGAVKFKSPALNFQERLTSIISDDKIFKNLTTFDKIRYL